MERKLILTVLLASIALSACGGGTTTQIGGEVQPRNDQIAQESVVPTPIPVAPGQDGSYASGYAIPAVTTVYIITGTVQAAPGSVQGYQMQGQWYSSKYGGSGYVSGGNDGKGILRFLIDAENGVKFFDPYVDAGKTKRMEGWTPLVRDGEFVILKVEDRKGSALAQGDHVRLMCREQYEWVMPVAGSEIPTTQTMTREIDGCRLIDPGDVTPATPETNE